MRANILVIILTCGILASYGQECPSPAPASIPIAVPALQPSATPEAEKVTPPPRQESSSPQKEEDAPMPLWRKIAGFSMLGFLVFWMFWRNVHATKEQEQTEEES